MKKLILVLVLIGIQAEAADIEFRFDYSYQTPGCADAADVNCVEGFEVRDQKDGLVVAQAAATPGASTPAVDIPATATGYPRLGNRTFAAFAIARDNEGGRIESLQSLEVSEVIRPTAPANVRATAK